MIVVLGVTVLAMEITCAGNFENEKSGRIAVGRSSFRHGGGVLSVKKAPLSQGEETIADACFVVFGEEVTHRYTLCKVADNIGCSLIQERPATHLAGNS